MKPEDLAKLSPETLLGLYDLKTEDNAKYFIPAENFIAIKIFEKNGYKNLKLQEKLQYTLKKTQYIKNYFNDENNNNTYRSTLLSIQKYLTERDTSILKLLQEYNLDSITKYYTKSLQLRAEFLKNDIKTECHLNTYRSDSSTNVSSCFEPENANNISIISEEDSSNIAQNISYIEEETSDVKDDIPNIEETSYMKDDISYTEDQISDMDDNLFDIPNIKQDSIPEVTTPTTPTTLVVSEHSEEYTILNSKTIFAIIILFFIAIIYYNQKDCIIPIEKEEILNLDKF